MSYTKQKLFKRLKSELNIDVPKDAYILRTRAGRWQKAQGAWTSIIRSETDTMFEIGLYISIAELLKCPKWDLFDIYGLCVDCGCKGKCKGLK